MTIDNIIKAVRLCIDEESGTTDYVDASMDNIITAKIGDAMRWLCLYCDASLLTAGTSTDANTSMIRTCTIDKGTSGDSDITYEDGIVTLPYNFMRVIRVRAESWHRSVSKVVTEDSEYYLMQSDDTAQADIGNPVVALIDDVPNKLELFPKPTSEDKIHITYVIAPSDITATSSTTDVSVPVKAKSAFIYYIAYLVMCAYNDVTKANTMLGVAKAQLGGAQPTTDAG